MQFLLHIPIWHGLRLAREILGNGMPDATLAREVEESYKAGLDEYAAAIEAQSPNAKEGGYTDQALSAWREVIRP